jgi:hypothetical protein
MVKKQYYRHSYSQEVEDVSSSYDDDHYQEFYDLLFNELLVHIKKIPFDNIIQNHLQYNNSIYRTEEANSLTWFYTADRKLIKSRTIYSFRFANVCHPELYNTFETKAHRLFLLITRPRHRYVEWYKYMGHELLNHLDNYLNIGRVVQNQIPHKTELFINQNEERLDIQFSFDSINERIAITFEPGPPYIHT